MITQTHLCDIHYTWMIYAQEAKKQMDKDGIHWSFSKTAWISAVIAAGAVVISTVTVVSFLYKKMNALFDS